MFVWRSSPEAVACGRFVLYCRPGDKEWTKYEVDFDNGHETLCNAIFGSDGKMYVATSWKGRYVVIDTSGASVEKIGMVVPPDTCPMHHPYLTFWVESADGDIFLVRFYLHTHRALGITNIDVHRMDTTTARGYVWRRVESIGGATFFLGANCVAAVPSSSSAAAAGTTDDQQANCVFLLLFCCDGIRLYSVRLDDRTISFSLLLPTSCPDLEDLLDTWSNLYWIIPLPQSFRQEQTKSLMSSTASTTSKVNKNIVSVQDRYEMMSPASAWSGLPIELIELLIPKLSFVDYLHIRVVCKQWNLIEKPIQHARTHPMLMSIHGASRGAYYRLFDPLVKKQYVVKKDSIVLHGNWPTLRFSKHGWLLVTKGKRRIYAANPFTGEVCKLPKMDRHLFHGISFSSVPKSPGSVVFAISKYPWQRSVGVMLWRAGDNHWLKEELPCDTPFFMTHSNPVFFDNEFYCLGVHGNLGVFNPNDITWRILDKPEPIRADAADYADRLCNLVEFKGDLIAIFRPYDANPIEMYKLDQSLMSWEKVLRLDDGVLFVDNWNATIKSSQEYDGCCNRIYLPFFGYDEVEGCKEGLFYDLEADGQYKPEFYGLTEPINSLWMEPNFSRHH
ncbi:hypothetical protein GQ55_2G482800 [Panicum hallii var. hallii]|uniref:Uncharacterized protein n=1 Tax=Panicum hallii var. hallii TaxID=1504633 RepID=A0A2T7F0D2_9POAL|nr:hypothetical protein GQ55_2G482800 [Panicum hallii var. hallii]